MEKRVLSVALALCLLLSSHSMASAQQEIPSPQRKASLYQEGVPLPVEDSLPQEKDTLSQESLSPSLGEDFLPQEDGSLEKATLSQEIPLHRRRLPRKNPCPYRPRMAQSLHRRKPMLP